MVVCYWVGDDEHIIYIDTDSIGLWREVVKNSENSLEQIAVKGVGQNTLKQIGGSWPRYQKIHRAIILMCFCILDQLPP